ncbi:MAG: RNA methyltransferase [Thermodesulfobacteriota bacterium]
MNRTAVCIVLVGPQGNRNLGAVARVMMNFGFTDLRLVAPEADPASEEARHMAVNAADLLAGAGCYADLPAALADCHLAYGTTRRFGRYREEFALPDEAAAVIAALPAGHRVAMVFGREDSGLTTDELACCQRFLTIPADEALPSLNLAQAVGVCLYEAAKAIRVGGVPIPQPDEPASGAEYEGLYAHMRQTLLAIGFLDPQNPEHIMRALRRMLGRQGVTSREIRILRGMFSQIDWAEAERRRLGKGGTE